MGSKWLAWFAQHVRGGLVFLAVGVLAMAAPQAHAGRVRPLTVVASFNFAQGETPENLAVAHDGTIYVSLAYAGMVWQRRPDGQTRRVTLPTRGGITVGVALVPHADDTLVVAVRSSDAQAAGIWQVTAAAFAGQGGITRLAALPTTAFPNGMAFDDAGNLYVADSTLARVWVVRPHTHTAAVWRTDPLLAPNGSTLGTFPFPGANGLKVWHDRVIVSNTSTHTILRIPILAQGQAGPVSVWYTAIQSDDFILDGAGNLYIASLPTNRVLRVNSAGHVSTLATATDGLDYPSAVAFGRDEQENTVLYITNAGYFGTVHTPSLASLRLPNEQDEDGDNHA